MLSFLCRVVFLLSVSGTALACPGPTDMAKGVIVTTMSADGIETRHHFRKTGPGEVVETRRSRGMNHILMTERRLFLGLLPVAQEVLEGSAQDRLVNTSRTSYPGQDLTSLRLGPAQGFTVEARTEWVDGRRQSRLIHYALGVERKRRYFGCLIPTVEITATERGGAHDIVHSYVYFTRLGFGVELATTSANKARAVSIMSIEPAGR